MQEIHDLLTAPGEPFEIEVVEIDGRPTKVWKSAPRSIRHLLQDAVVAHAERTYAVLGDERLTYAELGRRVGSVAHWLVALGVRPGDRVAIAMRNYTDWPVAFFAIAAVGATSVPLNAWWTGSEMTFGLEDSGSTVLIADGERLARLRNEPEALAKLTVIGMHLDDRRAGSTLPDGIIELAYDGPTSLPDVDVAPEDDALISYTSGTTGYPKGVWSVHRQACSGVWNVRFAAARQMALAGMPSPWIPPPARMLTPVPFFHATGYITGVLAQATTGGTLVLMRRWDPEAAVRLIERERVTGLSGVPSMAWDIINAANFSEHDLSSLQGLGGGGAAMPPAFVQAIAERLPGRSPSSGYGMTETSSAATTIGGADFLAHPKSVGYPIPIVDVRIVGDDGHDVPVGEPGEIWMRGASVAKGYWRRPEETAATFTDGWIHSGDLGRLDEDGYLYVVDRIKDMVLRGGENVSSAEVEAALFRHPAVADVAVIGVPHPSLGEEVGVVVHLKPGATLDVETLREHAAARLAAFKVPSHIWFRDQPFPRNAAGKVLKRALRDEIVQPA